MGVGTSCGLAVAGVTIESIDVGRPKGRRTTVVGTQYITKASNPPWSRIAGSLQSSAYIDDMERAIVTPDQPAFLYFGLTLRTACGMLLNVRMQSVQITLTRRHLLCETIG